MISEPQLATAQDIPSIVSLFQGGFNDPYFLALFPPNEAGARYLTTTFTSFVSDGTPGRLHVIRNGGGAVKAFVLHFEEGLLEYQTRWSGFENGMDAEKLNEFSVPWTSSTKLPWDLQVTSVCFPPSLLRTCHLRHYSTRTE